MAILPASVAEIHRAAVHALAFTAPPLRSRIELAWRSGEHASPAATALIGRA
jgi:DNA-binding transcriptional LysR family regulator